MKNGNVMGFRGYRFFSPKSSKAKYKTLGTSEANFGGQKTAYNTRGSTVFLNFLYYRIFKLRNVIIRH